MPFLTVEGRRAHYVHRRPVPCAGPPVLFLHGAGGSHQHWLYQVHDLPSSPGYALDLPGHGQSEGPGRDTIGAYAGWLVSFLDAAGLRKAVLVGHSMGGAIALETALRHPDRVAGLGLVATGARLRIVPAILECMESDAPAAVKLICDFAFGPDASEEMVRLGRRQMAATAPEVFLGDLQACDRFDAMDRLGELSVPAVVVCGTHDRMTPAKYSAYLRDQIPGAALHLVEGAGHMVMIENPQPVVRALTGFLKRAFPPLSAGGPG